MVYDTVPGGTERKRNAKKLAKETANFDLSEVKVNNSFSINLLQMSFLTDFTMISRMCTRPKIFCLSRFVKILDPVHFISIEVNSNGSNK